MKFIQVTEKDTKQRVLIPVDKILSITQHKDLTAVIDTHTDKNGSVYCICTQELYLEIVKQIRELA